MLRLFILKINRLINKEQHFLEEDKSERRVFLDWTGEKNILLSKGFEHEVP